MEEDPTSRSQPGGEPGQSNQKPQGQVVEGGFQPTLLPAADFNPGQLNQRPVDLPQTKGQTYRDPLIYRNVVLAVFLLVIVAGVSVLGLSVLHKSSTLNLQLAKTPSSPSSTTQSTQQPSASANSNNQSASGSQPATAAPSTSGTNPTTSSSGAIGAPASPTITNLSNSDNGTTITPSVGNVLSIRLSQLPNEAGYHWNPLAESFATRQLGGDPAVGPSHQQGSDGSIYEVHLIRASGNFTLGYSDIPDCSPTCGTTPIVLWQVYVHVP